MLLVMSNGGYLAPPDENPDREELWNETWKRVNRFLPNFFAELFPEEAGKPKRSKDVPIREVKNKENEKKDEQEKPVQEPPKGDHTADDEEEEDGEEEAEPKEKEG